MVSKYTTHSPHKRIVRGRAVSKETKYLINKMFYDDGLSYESVKKTIGLGRPTMDRELFTTRGEWEVFREKTGKQEADMAEGEK